MKWPKNNLKNNHIYVQELIILALVWTNTIQFAITKMSAGWLKESLIIFINLSVLLQTCHNGVGWVTSSFSRKILYSYWFPCATYWLGPWLLGLTSSPVVPPASLETLGFHLQSHLLHCRKPRSQVPWECKKGKDKESSGPNQTLCAHFLLLASLWSVFHTNVGNEQQWSTEGH